MKRSEKEQIVAEVTEVVGRAQGMFFTDFGGLTVEQATELRREFRKSGVDYRVVKNTLIRKALESVTGYDKVYDKLVGPTGVAFAFNDPVVPAKIIQKFSEKHSKLSLKVCVLDKEVYDGARLAELAKLPSRKEMMASILGSIQSPLTGVPTVINAVLRDLVSVIGEIEKKKAA
ncbi:MAG TPA: 50S ribosomal protein L10 [Bacteroidota bacterium]|jgi:large subunit ribosomal protein L10|nr:50S ribosomal protein L10 [Bacteroidota bacterium]